MDATQADQFAKSWTDAWNNHDLDALMVHYAEEIVFYSPFISRIIDGTKNVIKGKEQLRAYFAKGMEEFPHVRFQLHRTGLGVGSIVLNYISVDGMLANEIHVLDSEGKSVEVRCHYSESV